MRCASASYAYKIRHSYVMTESGEVLAVAYYRFSYPLIMFKADRCHCLERDRATDQAANILSVNRHEALPIKGFTEYSTSAHRVGPVLP